MDKKLRITLIVLGSILLAGSIGIVIHQLTKKDDSTDNDTNDRLDRDNQSQSASTQLGNSSTSSNPQTGALIKPQFDVEGQLSNPFNEIEGKTLYPKTANQGGYGYANVRSSAEVNNNTSWWTDGVDNLITTISSPTSIGRVLSVQSVTFNGFAYKWYKVKLDNPTGGWFTPYTEGFVRADTVTFQPY